VPCGTCGLVFIFLIDGDIYWQMTDSPDKAVELIYKIMEQERVK
jgi:uncharacterized protein YuzB (UPF0349 family)